MLPHILILAAGDSSRLGQPKQLVKLGGRPALHMTISNAVAVAGQAVTVVVGAHAAALTSMLKRSSASWILNRAWEEGMGSSIRAGIAALPIGCEAVLILLGDQVAVSADDLKRLTSAWNGESTVIAAAQYEQQTGVPAIFPAFCFSELAALRGDQGAKAVLHRHRDRVVRVAMPNAAVDLDTPDDLQILIERFGAAGD
jgi:CTP:molybdopterin cytidylyltransferase MocA